MGTPCRECPSIICRQCIELTGQDWDQVRSLPDWSCPRCEGDCPCKRCRNKVANGKSQSPPKNKRKRPATIREDNAYSPKSQKTSSRLFPSKPEKSTETKGSRIKELINKNQQCLDYIVRTQRLLSLIKSEQGRLQTELDSIAQSNYEESTKCLLSAVTEELFLSEVDNEDNEDTEDSDSTSSDEYCDGDLDFSKFKNNESFAVPNIMERTQIMA